MVEVRLDRIGVDYNGQEIFYGEVWTKAGRSAAALNERGIGADRVVTREIPEVIRPRVWTVRTAGVY